VHVGLKRQGGHLQFAVSDNGIGIAPEYKENILGCLSVSMPAMSIQGSVSDWPSARGLLTGTMGGSGSNPIPDADQSSASDTPLEETATPVRGYILIVEDNEADVFLIQKAIEAKKLRVILHVVRDGISMCSHLPIGVARR
jgi:hypothetical protein